VKNTTAGKRGVRREHPFDTSCAISAISAVKHFFTGLSEEWRDLRGSGLGCTELARNARLKFETSPKPQSSGCRAPFLSRPRAASRFTQARAQHVLVRRHTSDPFERPQEMVRAEAGLSRKRSERQSCSLVPLDCPDDSGHPCDGIRRRRARIGPSARAKSHRTCRQSDAELFPRHIR